MYLPLLLDLIVESPVVHGDTIIPYEEVVTSLEKDTISMGTRIGLESNTQFSCGPFSNIVSMMIQVEPKKYEKGVQWLCDLLFNTVIKAERVRVCAAKIANAVSQAKRKGNSVVCNLLKSMYYKSNSNVQICSMLRQHRFLTKLLEDLDNDQTSDGVLKELENVRKTIMTNDRMTVHVTADWKKMESLKIDLTKTWQKLAKDNNSLKTERLDIVADHCLLKPNIYQDTTMQGTVVGLGCIESAFLYHAAPSIKDFKDTDLPALMLFMQYLTQLEGPLWREIRGKGLAYGYNLQPRPNEGLLYFTLYRATNVAGAYRETKDIIVRLFIVYCINILFINKIIVS